MKFIYLILGILLFGITIYSPFVIYRSNNSEKAAYWKGNYEGREHDFVVISEQLVKTGKLNEQILQQGSRTSAGLDVIQQYVYIEKGFLAPNADAKPEEILANALVVSKKLEDNYLTNILFVMQESFTAGDPDVFYGSFEQMKRYIIDKIETLLKEIIKNESHPSS